MPYPITERDGKFYVNGKGYDTREEALKYQRALYANVPDAKKAMIIVKQANGLYRWTSTSTNNIQDRDGETLSLKALQADVARTKMFGDDDGCLYFYHIPYAIGGAPDYRALVGGMLIESGEFYEQPVAKAIAEYCKAHPDGLDGSGWGTSVGFMGVPDHAGIYHSVLIRERSILPLSKAANAYTSFGVKEKMALTIDQQKALDTVLGDETLLGVVKTALSAQDQSKMADAVGVVRKAAQPADKPVTPAANPVKLKAGKNVATPQAAMGFGAPVTKAADEGQASEEAVIAAAQANLEVASTALGNAADAVGTLPAREAAEDAEETGEGETPAMPEVKADGQPVPTPDPTEPPAPTVKGGLSDEDLQGIAKFVHETVTKAVGEAMTQMKAEFQASMTKMQRTFATETQVKMLNEVPRTTFDRLKAFGVTPAPAGGIAKGEDGYVEKGTNLPDAPEAQTLAAMLGFGV